MLRICLSGFEGEQREKLITIITRMKGKHEINLQHGVHAVVSNQRSSDKCVCALVLGIHGCCWDEGVGGRGEKGKKGKSKRQIGEVG